ncbi:uncharacterized protein BP01DRAFT_233458 [Aspergillus saccharolyticus JOP 1030-1]|uniref:Uncharacterized protein n=1 Tax=Aspergillus saccharolyticus JOP 1030-1 TaxID=1450539 RepID=A0A318ZX90_9EURO|nr:hypothetical protein BP01DRAFT_233458 [Aspergillus saccharolyticus JOP 1030-1]PYH40082.1 hypothetical protein BP01DRAFT_233458 [Aspergillus saccharolyticus JOP 1030-1]
MRYNNTGKCGNHSHWCSKLLCLRCSQYDISTIREAETTYLGVCFCRSPSTHHRVSCYFIYNPASPSPTASPTSTSSDLGKTTSLTDILCATKAPSAKDALTWGSKFSLSAATSATSNHLQLGRGILGLLWVRKSVRSKNRLYRRPAIARLVSVMMSAKKSTEVFFWDIRRAQMMWAMGGIGISECAIFSLMGGIGEDKSSIYEDLQASQWWENTTVMFNCSLNVSYDKIYSSSLFT